MLLASCQPDTGCRQETKVTAGVSVEWNKVDTMGVSTRITQWDSVTVQGVGTDSILYSNARSINELRLPLRPDTSLTEYEITWHGMTERLRIYHDNDRRYISMACGCIIFHTLDTVVSDQIFIEKAEIVNAAVENYEQTNIHLTLTTISE